MNKITNGVVINTKGIKLSTGDTIHFGHTLDVVSKHKFGDGKPGFIVQPHGLDDGPFAVKSADIRVSE